MYQHPGAVQRVSLTQLGLRWWDEGAKRCQKAGAGWRCAYEGKLEDSSASRFTTRARLS